MNKITKRVLSTALVFPLLYGNTFVHAEGKVNLPGSGLHRHVDVETASGWDSLNVAQKVAAIGVPSAVGAIFLGFTIGYFCKSGKGFSVVLIGGSEDMQSSVVNCLRRRASRKGGNSRVAEVLSYVADEEGEAISGKSHPVGERAVKFDKWKIHNIFADGNGVLSDNPKNSELISKADVIIVVADDAQSKNNIHKSIGKDTAKPLYKDGALIVHVGDEFKKLKDVKAKLADIQEKDFLVPVVNIGNCQHSHGTGVPYGEGGARSRDPFSRELVLPHLNEALRLNRQGLEFKDKFFHDCVLPLWEEENKDLYAALTSYDRKNMMSIPEMQKLFRSSLLKDLKINAVKDGQAQSLEDYIFGRWKGLNGNSRIECLKNTDQHLYDMFWDELSWINGNVELLNREDPNEDIDPNTRKRPPYKNRLINTASNVNAECDTELRSFIASVATILDDLSLIKQGQGQRAMDQNELTNRILTRVRKNCREDLAQKAALDITMKSHGGAAAVPEMQAMLRLQFADALNLPNMKVADGNEEFMPKECGVVYSTNILSSIMNIEAIASVATDFAKKLDGANKFDELSKNYDCEVSYDECCKILDRSARHMLKGDKRSFDARFRSAVEQCACNGVDHDDLDLFYNWINGTNKESFSDICATLALDLGDDDSNKSLVPEVYCLTPEKFGCLTFIKHLVDQRYIVLK